MYRVKVFRFQASKIFKPLFFCAAEVLNGELGWGTTKYGKKSNKNNFGEWVVDHPLNSLVINLLK